MSVDPFGANLGDHDAPDPLTRALSSLAAQQPPTDGWQLLRSELESSKAKRPGNLLADLQHRRSRWLALAAVLALAAITFQWHSPDVETPATAEVLIKTHPAITSLSDHLVTESAQLESMLTWMAPGARSAEALALDMSLVDRLQWVDHLLADPYSSDATREVLWSERVELLAQRVALSQRESLVASRNEMRELSTL